MDAPWRYFPPSARAEARRGRRVLDLIRRGVDHGVVVLGDAKASPTVEPARAWRAAEAVFLPELVADGVSRFAAAIDASLEMFARLREGARFLDELEQRLWDDEDFVYAGSTVDAVDRREIEKVFVDAPAAPGRYHARDLSAKLSWIADDEQDLSLRIRFSFGHEATRDWLKPGPRAQWSDRFAERVFPECEVLTGSNALHAALDTCLDRAWRLSERIVYANAPGGGAMFHHDADPEQRGVVFAQLSGHTVWLALPRAELADRLTETSAGLGDADSVGAALDGVLDPPLWDALNANPTLTARLASTGRLFVLAPGDVMLLPSHGVARCAWHSVFGVGDATSLAHSYGIFDRT